MDGAPDAGSTRPAEEFALKAAPDVQLRLLDLQATDTRLDQLAHRRRTLPELAEVDKLERGLAEARDATVAAETERGDLERARVKAEGDVEQVRTRARRDQQRLDAGQVGSPRDLQNLQSEIVSLARRQSELEDVELEIMERVEEIDERLREVTTRRGELTDEHVDAVARRDARLREIDAEVASLTDRRAQLAADVDPPLLTLYEKIRTQTGGVGAAPLLRRRCSGCQLELDVTELNAVRAAPEDEVLRHEECRRVLVRTPDSGL